MIEKPKRFAIIGLPASGKSTFSSKLGMVLDIPVHHLDRHIFEADGKKRDREEFLSIQQQMLNEAAWIVEGCSISTLEMRFTKADIVIDFQFPRLLCLWRICKRYFVFDKDLSNSGCLRGVNAALIKYIWNFNKEKRKGIEKLRLKYPRIDYLIFRSSKEAESYLEQISSSG